MCEALCGLDRRLTLLLNGSDSLFWDGVAMTATRTVTWIPFFAVLLFLVLRAGKNRMRDTLCVLAAVGLCVLLCDAFVSSVVKPFVARPRPTHDAELAPLIDVVRGYRGGAYGFFSSHAANTAALATLFSLLFRGKRFTAHLFFWVWVNCWTRVYLGVHYVGDLAVGFLWGGLTGWGAYRLVRRFSPRMPDACRHVPTAAAGYVLLLTYAYVAVRAFFFG